MKGVKVKHPDFKKAILHTVLKYQRGNYLAQIQYKTSQSLKTVLQIKGTYAKGNPLKWANKILADAASLGQRIGTVSRGSSSKPSDKSHHLIFH